MLKEIVKNFKGEVEWYYHLCLTHLRDFALKHISVFFLSSLKLILRVDFLFGGKAFLIMLS